MLAPVHPRVCGEQIGVLPRFCRLSGSSPRVRGTAQRSTQREHRGRFIPACAGNSGIRQAQRSGTPVHPRVCGEQIRRLWSQRREDGSSPRVRGTVRCRGCCPAETRFIPACAGNRRPTGRGSPPSSVHPRVCGEQKTLITGFAA